MSSLPLLLANQEVPISNQTWRQVLRHQYKVNNIHSWVRRCSLPDKLTGRPSSPPTPVFPGNPLSPWKTGKTRSCDRWHRHKVTSGKALVSAYFVSDSIHQDMVLFEPLRRKTSPCDTQIYYRSMFISVIVLCFWLPLFHCNLPFLSDLVVRPALADPGKHKVNRKWCHSGPPCRYGHIATWVIHSSAGV